MSRVILLLIAASLIGCGPKPNTDCKVEANDNGIETEARQIIDLHGCSIYRINDKASGHWIYFTRCPNSTLSVH